MVKDMTSGKPLRLILAFCLPLIAGNLFQQFYNMADSIVVGQFIGVNALAAVGATGSLNFLVIGFVLGMCSGFSIPVSQAFGAGDMKQMRRCIANAVYLSIGIVLLLTTLTMLFTRQILQLVQTPADIMEDSYQYIVVIFAGSFAIMFYNLLACILRAVGDSKTPLYFLVIASFLNVGLDLLFVLGFHSGVAGAAYATVIAQAVSALLCLIYMIKKFPFLLPQKDERKVDAAIMGHLLYMGLPMALQFSITAVGTIILQSAVNSLGSAVVAAVAAAGKVQNIVFQPMETLGITMATYCGQNLGARKIDRIRTGIRQSFAVSMAYCVVACAATALWGTKVALLFIKAEEIEILRHVGHFLFLNGFFYPALGSLFIFRNSLQGMGFGLPAMAAGIFELVARSLVVFAFLGTMGYNAVCIASPMAWIAANLLLVPVYIYEMRILHRRQDLVGQNTPVS